jgi:serine/threonine-protein kinase HipA
MNARRRSAGRLGVWSDDRRVGTLERSRGGALTFGYAAEHLGDPDAVPVSLSLPLREEGFSGAAVEAVIDNLLPDEVGVRRAIATRTHADGVDPFSLLAAIGRDCVGSLRYLPDDEVGTAPGPPTGMPIEEDDIAALLADLAVAPLGVGGGTGLRISIAGAQEKTALLQHEGRWFVPTGSTPSTHIFKPSIGPLRSGPDLTHSVENEFVCLRLAAELGLPVANAAVERFGGRSVLVVERYDRRFDGRVWRRRATEDLCQALGVPSFQKYEADGGPGMPDVFGLLAGSDEPATDRATFLRAAFVFWLLGATDGHAKNFSVFLGARGSFRLAPLYDVLSLQPDVDGRRVRRNEQKLAMAVGARRHYAVDVLARRHFEQSATLAGIDAASAATILDDVRERVPVAIERVIAQVPPGTPEALVASIFSAIRTRAAV